MAVVVDVRLRPRALMPIAAHVNCLRRGDSACIAPASAEALIRGSSVVEQPAVNRLVVGSNPTRGAMPWAGLGTKARSQQNAGMDREGVGDR